jgi:sulfur-oxidizing protein SoxA
MSVRRTVLAAVFFSLAAPPLLAEGIAPADRRSSYDMMSADTQRLQDDETLNPGMLWVLDGEAAWERKAGPEGKACASCHADPAVSMKGVAARYPVFDRAAGRVVNIEHRINLCRARHQQTTPLAMESKELLALSTLIGLQSRGQPIITEVSPQSKASYEAGRALFSTRLGQLDLACQHCHDERWGRKLAGVPIPQAHPTGYPIYRLEWQAMGSLARRLRNCMIGMRAEPFALESQEYVDLELYLKVRAQGLKLETPGVRP